MRTRITYIVVLLVGILTSCTLEEFNPDDWAVDPMLELSESGVVFNATNNTDTIHITTNYSSFKTSCVDSWCSIESNGSVMMIKVSPNMNSEQRRTAINITVGRGSKTLTKTFSVVQMGGYWDVVDQFSIYWSSNVTETQKSTISDMLSNMVYVKGSTFIMGCQGDNPLESNYNGAYYDKDCRHKVTLSDFFINKTEVTQKQWNIIMGHNSSNFKGENLPVENISWEEAVNFVTKLSQLTNLNFSLPTEAQWEYAARGGIYSMGYLYPGSNDDGDVLIYKGSGDVSDPSFSTYPVGQFWPNELGLYDMAGNVSEMCLDWYGDYVTYDTTDPIGPAIGKYHILRGGDITNWPPLFCTIYSRQQFITKTDNYIGLRLCIKN